jgi:predicted dehydrogenase
MASEQPAIALVGAGRMGSVHLEALRRADGVRLAGVVELFEPARARVAQNGIETYESVEELLASSAPDGVVIAGRPISTRGWSRGSRSRVSRSCARSRSE